MKHIKQNTEFKEYMMHPAFLFSLKISETAKNVYVLLLNRNRLSQKNYETWHDKTTGNVYSNYTIESLAKDMHKSPSTIKHCLKELREADLIETKKVGMCMPSKIFVKLDDDAIKEKDESNKGGSALDEDMLYCLEDDELPF